ncbi:parallel beta-helix domain-containing protein [Labilithrix luteola]|nr:parallel beta-helix domain-containing protein [Labilithrix luteola]
MLRRVSLHGNAFVVMALMASLSGCSSSDGNTGGSAADPNFPNARCGAGTIPSANCVQVAGGDAQGLLNATNALTPGAVIVLGQGTFAMTNQVTIRENGIHLIGQGIDATTLDFKTATAQTNGVDVVGNDFLVQGLTVRDSKKDGIRVESSERVTFRAVKATWSTPESSTNGAYGIYPVKSKFVLVENSFAERAADAGLYVGQCQNAVVRNNTVTGNVAGLEIENTEFADVSGNTAENNTTGIVVFDLPGNPIPGRDVNIHDNIIRNNNGKNFAAGGTVASVPVGTGTFAMASRRVQIANNTYQNNNTVDIGLVSGLVIEQNKVLWSLPKTSLVGDWQDLNLLPGFDANGNPVNDQVSTFRLENIVVSGNKHSGSGTAPDLANPLQIGLVLSIIYKGQPVDSIVYDTIGETDLTTNDNHICVGGNTNGSFGSLDLAKQAQTLGTSPVLRFSGPPFGQFNCTTLNGNPIQAPTLPANQP